MDGRREACRSLQGLVESHIEVTCADSEFVFSMRFLRNSPVWRNRRYMFGDKRSFHAFEIPASVLLAKKKLVATR